MSWYWRADTYQWAQNTFCESQLCRSGHRTALGLAETTCGSQDACAFSLPSFSSCFGRQPGEVNYQSSPPNTRTRKRVKLEDGHLRWLSHYIKNKGAYRKGCSSSLFLTWSCQRISLPLILCQADFQPLETLYFYFDKFTEIYQATSRCLGLVLQWLMTHTRYLTFLKLPV